MGGSRAALVQIEISTMPWDHLELDHYYRVLDVEHSHVRFLGNLVLNLWDCGGQESYMDQYFQSQKENIFRNVEVLIYVFDVESREFDKDIHYYQSCLEGMLEFFKLDVLGFYFFSFELPTFFFNIAELPSLFLILIIFFKF